MRTCWIVGAGEFTPRGFAPQDGDFIIAADGGLRALLSLGVRPHLVIGDLDSLDEPVPDDLPLHRLPVEKDDTDTAAAVEIGISKGFRRFRLYGCGGGRADHLLANFQLLGKYSKAGMDICLAACGYDAYAVTNGALSLPPRAPRTTVSVFCHGDCAGGVTLRGLRYPLNRYTLTCDFPLGVSNEHTDAEASVSVEDGTLLVLQALSPEGGR